MTLNTGNARLMKSLFNDQNYLIKETDPAALSRQLYILAGCIQHTDLAGQVMLYDLFTPEEIMSHWKKLNAKYYIINGACTSAAMRASEVSAPSCHDASYQWA